MNGWEKKYDGPFAAMSSATFEDSPNNEMFMKLFKYIVGVNKAAAEIEMTRPVTTRYILLRETQSHFLSIMRMF